MREPRFRRVNGLWVCGDESEWRLCMGPSVDYAYGMWLMLRYARGQHWW